MRSLILLDSQVWDPIHHVSGYEDRSYVVEQYQLTSKTADEGSKYDEASDFDNMEQETTLILHQLLRHVS